MDVLVGVMGAALTNMLFLNEESTVAGILEPGAAYAGFPNLAKISTTSISLFTDAIGGF